MDKRVLVINPGSTSTKLALFCGTEKVFDKTLRHSREDLQPFAWVMEQADFRQKAIEQALAEQRIRLGSQAEGEEKLLRRMVGNVTEYMDAAGLSNRLDEHDRALLAEHDGEPEAAPVMGGMQL